MFGVAACEDPVDPPPHDTAAIAIGSGPAFAGPLDTIDLAVTQAELPEGAWVRWFVDGATRNEAGLELRAVAPPEPDTMLIVVEAGTDRVLAADSVRIVVSDQFVVLKADDLGLSSASELSPEWRWFIDYVEAYDLAAGIGLVAQALETDGPEFVSAARVLAASPRVEIWNHGYDHMIGAMDSAGNAYNEFRGTSYEHQLDHLRRAQQLALDSLGIVMRTFGAPGNGVDSVTVRALAAVPELDVWLFGLYGSDKVVLPRIVEAEERVGRVSYAVFEQTWDPEAAVITLQLHPASWPDDSRLAFDAIVRTLRERGAAFIRPMDYADYLTRPGRARS